MLQRESFVVRSTPRSIHNGTWSLVALLETLASVACFFWLVRALGWGFPTLLVSFAAPALLLRSAPAIKLGLRLLSTAASNEVPGRTFANCLASAATTVTAASLLYSITQSNSRSLSIFALLTPVGLAFFAAFYSSASARLRSLTQVIEVSYAVTGILLAIGTLAGLAIAISTFERADGEVSSLVALVAIVIVALVITSFAMGSIRDARAQSSSSDLNRRNAGSKNTDSTYSLFENALTRVSESAISLYSAQGTSIEIARDFLLTLIVFVVSLVIAAAVLAGLFAITTSVLAVVILSAGAAVAVMGGSAIGTIVLGIGIRTAATLRYFGAGFRAMPENWRRTVLVEDLFHAPELLPRASTLNAEYSAGGLLRAAASLSAGYQRVVAYSMVLGLYVSAILYRYSIKATAWIWWPISLAARTVSIRRRLPRNDLRRITAASVAGPMSVLVRAGLFFLALAVCYQLLSSNAAILLLIPNDTQTMIRSFVDVGLLPPPGLRLLALSASVLFATIYWWKISQVLAAFEEPLKAPTEFEALTGHERVSFTQAAHATERLRLLMLASLVSFIEFQLIYAASFVYPEQVRFLFWPAFIKNL